MARHDAFEAIAQVDELVDFLQELRYGYLKRHPSALPSASEREQLRYWQQARERGLVAADAGPRTVFELYGVEPEGGEA